MKFKPHQLIAAGVLASLGLIAVAQPAPASAGPGSAPPPMQRGPSMEHGRMHNDMHQGTRDGSHEGMREQFMARRLARLKETLRITPGQEGAWAAYTGALRPTQHQRPDVGEMARLTTPERIDRMRAMRSQRAAEMDRRGEATKNFYAGLSAEQKRVFDQVTLRQGGREGRGGHRHHG